MKIDNCSNFEEEMKKILLFVVIFFSYNLIIFANLIEAKCPGYKQTCWGDTLKSVKLKIDMKIGGSLFDDCSDGYFFNGTDDMGSLSDLVIFEGVELPPSLDDTFLGGLSNYLPKGSFNKYIVKNLDAVFFYNKAFFCYAVHSDFSDSFQKIENILTKQYSKPTETKQYDIGAWMSSMGSPRDSQFIMITVRDVEGTKIIHTPENVLYFDSVIFNKIKVIIQNKRSK
jgi:hypothetical protein